MALKISITTVHGINVIEAYHRVECVQIISKNKICFQLRSYAEAGRPHFADKYCEADYVLDGENPIAQAYAHVKTMSEFSGAVDC